MTPPTQRQYFSFFWPLTFMGLAMLLSRQFQNAVLAGYPDAAKELAIFAYASSLFWPFNIALGFVPQMTNILSRCRRNRQVCFRFVLAASLILSAPLLVLAFTPLGALVVTKLFDVWGEDRRAVVQYLMYLSPLVLINGLRHYATGLLIQVKRTGYVTVLNILFLSAVIASLLLGVSLGWRAIETLALAQVSSAVLHLVLSWIVLLKLYKSGEEDTEPLTYRKTFDFYWPVAITAVMFSLSRPVIYGFASRTPDAVVTVASLRVAFDFALLFHMPLNQMRNLFATFGLSDLPGLRRFITRAMVGVSMVMLAVVLTPASRWILNGLMGVEGELLTLAREALMVLCLIPLIVTVRNYFHGLALVRRRTESMAAGGIARVLAIAFFSWLLFATGRLDHVFGASLLVLGFAAETLIVALSSRRPSRAEEA
ncbi:MAG: oligosaccharide flippase family protein [Planctomycetota bacterium]|jgi:hypothetical protein